MKTTLKLFILFFIFTLTSCDNAPSVKYKYEDKEAVLNCYDDNTKLISEAVYAFENDILKGYSKKGGTLSQAYSLFLTRAQSTKINLNNIISQHTYDVFLALKHDKSLWNTNNSFSKFNYQSSTMNCILKNLKDDKLKTTFNALLKTNSLRPSIMVAPLKRQSRKITTNKKLATYVALDLFYARLFDIDFSKITFRKENTENTNPTK